MKLEKGQRKFPETLYVRWEQEKGDEGYFLADADIMSAEDGEKVATYTLRAVQVKATTHELK